MLYCLMVIKWDKGQKVKHKDSDEILVVVCSNVYFPYRIWLQDFTGQRYIYNPQNLIHVYP